MESSLCEKPERHASRRLSDHLTFEGQKQKVHSLVDKVYSRENLKLAWERVRANRGASGADRVTIGGVFLLYQKGRDSRIFQAQDRAIDDFTLKGKSSNGSIDKF
jgi:hypothetical protein